MTDDPLILTPAELDRLRPFFYHRVTAGIEAAMTLLRDDYLRLAVATLRDQPPSRSQSLALTHLEEALLRAIQGLALQGEPVFPPCVMMADLSQSARVP